MEPENNLNHKVNQRQLVLNSDNIKRLFPKKIKIIDKQCKMVYFLIDQVHQMIEEASQNNLSNLSINVVIQDHTPSIILTPQSKKWISPQSLKSNLAKTFSYGTFQNLKSIHLRHMQIDNCEFLSFLDAPILECFHMQHNNITEMKSFQKMYLPSFKELKICSNLVREILLQRAKFSTMHVRIILEKSHRVFERAACQNISVLFKIDINFHRQVHTNSLHRINSQKLAQCLRRKFSKQEQQTT